jgi:hypothetical protein
MVGFGVTYHSSIDMKHSHSCSDQGKFNFAVEVKVEETFYLF